MTRATGPVYDLLDEIFTLWSGRSYHMGSLLDEEVWHETAGELQNVISTDQWQSYPPLPWLIKPLVEGNEWVRHQFLDSEGFVIDQTVAKVLGQKKITVKAGTFTAYKVEVTPDFGEPPEFSTHFEYYVPGIGLVLSESDRVIYISAIAPSGPTFTVYVRQVIRKELVSWNVF